MRAKSALGKAGAASTAANGLTPNPLWYREAVIYEIPVRAFSDSNGDGWGDLNGVTDKLDYLRDLGVNALWLLPFYPSPMRDGGYDIADYKSVHPLFGTLDDFKRLLDQAHARGLRVITELVINHTSKDHPWFQRARRSPPGSPHRDYYVWSDTPDRFAEARIIFKDFETSNWAWDPVGKAYYWHRFYSHQPDLNFDNSTVIDEITSVVDFWMELGVDGMRLDAVPYLFEREGTNCENLPETHAFLRMLRAHIDSRFRDRMLLAEANQWPADAAAYFGDGDECQMNFHFPLMPRIFMSLLLEDRFPIIDILRQTPAIPASCQWATFLRNHDELTLEMVTEQDRDNMYRVYADDPGARLNLGIRRRLAPLLKSRQKIELVNSLLFSLPGTPVIYYGDEIGMGDNIFLPDRDGVRTPMQWSGDRNAGFSRANPQKVVLPVITDPEYHYEAVNVEAQEANLHSLLWWTKRLIATARRNKVLGTGAIEFLQPDNHKILAYKRTHGSSRVLCVVNLSRFAQYVELDLSDCEGLVPVEVFSHVRFPTIGKAPYLLTLAPHSWFWFRLEPTMAQPDGIGRIELAGTLLETLSGGVEPEVGAVLLRYVRQRRWFRGKDREVKDVQVTDCIPLGPATDQVVVLLEIQYVEGEPETYVLALAIHAGEMMERRQQSAPHALVALVEPPVGDTSATPTPPASEPASDADPASAPARAALFDVLATGDVSWNLLDAIADRARVPGESGRLEGSAGDDLRALAREDPRPTARAPELEQTNTVLIVGQRALVKIYRQIEAGPNSEFEIGAFLTQRMQAPLAPRLLGSLDHVRKDGRRSLVGIVQEFVANEGDAWQVTREAIELYFDAILTSGAATPAPRAPADLLDASRTQPPPEVQDGCARYFGLARQLARRTADVHLTLASDPENPDFAPEPFTAQHQQSIHQWSHVRLLRTFERLRRKTHALPPAARDLAAVALPGEQALDDRLRRVATTRIQASRIRCHGDLHLGQVLFTGDDFVFIDFEGEPARPLNERRYKRCVLRDTVGMIRSFSYASESVLRGGRVRQQDIPTLAPWAVAWTDWVSAVYLGAYLEAIDRSPLLPASDEQRRVLLDFYELEKVIYEVQYELNNRPEWLAIPLAGLVRILQRPPKERTS